jgi:hypothetical protein
MTNWQEILKSLAPTVATAICGPLGGAAISALGCILGVDAPTQDKIKTAIASSQMTPEQVSQIKALELQYQNDENERGFKYAELQFLDDKSAREMQIATMSNVPPVLAILVTLGFFGILIFMVTNSTYKPTEPLLVMLGSLGTAWTMIIGFYFGSSHGSQNKDMLLAQSAPK